MRLKKGIAVLMGISMTAALFGGCTKKADDSKTKDVSSEKEDGTKEEASIVIAAYEDDIKKYDEIGLLDKLKEVHPEISVEFESFKDSGELDKAMKVRASANELPDIIFMKATELVSYKDYLVDVTDWDTTKKNLYAQTYAIDGKCYGIPAHASGCYTYYWKDMFKEANVEVPDTWPEFVEVAKKLQEHFGADDPDFAAIAMGAKDEWATYPYSEFIPLLQGKGDTAVWTNMGKTDHPFDKGTDIYNSYKKVYDLFTAGVCGKDPLGVGFDQTNTLFGARKCGMISISSGNAKKLADSGVDITELGTFFMPVRDSENDPYNVEVLADGFISVAKNSKYQQACKDFIDFFFSDPIYSEYVTIQNAMTCIDGVKTKLEPAIQMATDNVEQYNPVYIIELGGDDNYKSIEAEVQWNYKKLGTQFFINGFDFDGEMERLNTEWAKARTKLNIQ